VESFRLRSENNTEASSLARFGGKPTTASPLWASHSICVPIGWAAQVEEWKVKREGEAAV